MWSNISFEVKVSDKLKSRIKGADMLLKKIRDVYSDRAELNKEFYNYVDMKHISNSLAIEGGTLTENETRLLLEDNIVPRNKNNFKELIDYLQLSKAVSDMHILVKGSSGVSTGIILRLHRVLAESLVTNSGCYRTVRNM